MNTLLGQRIREQRKEKGWTIEQFAERVELSANYVGDLERGVKIPKLETFIRIVEVLGVSADVLIRDSVPSASHVADDELSKKLSKLTPGQKKAAIDILNAYTDISPISQNNTYVKERSKRADALSFCPQIVYNQHYERVYNANGKYLR